MDSKIDLHVHSYISDGTFSPRQVVEIAKENNVKAIALTDHDSVEGVNEALESAKALNINFLKGIEISSCYKDGKILHILGLGIDIQNANFLKAYEKMKKAREHSIIDIIKQIQKQGVHIDMEMLKKHQLNKYMDRYDIHRYLMINGICTDAQEVWDKYLDPIPYGEDEIVKVEEALKIINDAGGISFLAHYNKKIGLGGYTKGEMEEHFRYLISAGLNGVEKYYPSYKKEDFDFLQYLIDKYKLISSGGTDFHGENRPEIQIGTGYGDMLIPYSIYTDIKQRTQIYDLV